MAVLGIDLGTQNSVLATINRGAVSVIRTELADRLTPSLVLFSQGHRLMGDHAAPLVRSQAKACCRAFKNLLGEMFADSPRVGRERGFQLAEIAEAEGGVAGYRVRLGDQEEVVGAVRICAAFLTKLKHVAEASTQRPVGEVVIACPSWFREQNRQALLDAADVAGLTCLRVISDMTATALDYGLYRRQHFTDAKTVVAFVSVGHSTASVCIAAFTSSGAELLAEVSDPDLGGRDMDVLIAQHFAKIFEKQHGINPLENIKAKLKLEDQAERTKKILSANSETSFAVECLLEDRDISGLITRELFEELCAASFKPALVKLLQQAVAISGLDVSEIAFVEAVGGCTRIPWVQRCVSEVFGKEISRTLAGDECVARGCALQAAMASLHFKVKEFDFAEKLWRPICIRWTGEAPVAIASCSQQQEQQQQQQTEGAAVASCQEIELPIGTPTNTMRKITFIRSCPLELHATYKDLEGKTRAADLGGCRVELPEGSGEKEVHVFCSVNYNGLLRFPRACMKRVEAEEKNSPQSAAAAAAATATNTPSPEVPAASDGEQQQQQQQQEGQGQQQDAAAGDATGAAASPPLVAPAKVKVTELSVQPVAFAGRLSAETLRVYRELELQMDNEDRLYREKQERLNELETTIYSLREGLGASLGSFATEGEKEALLRLLEELENWVYDHQDDPQLPKSAVVAKLDALKGAAAPVQHRQQQQQLRTAAAEKLAATIRESRQIATGGAPEYAHIEQQTMQQLLQAAEADEGWLNKVMQDAAAMPLTATPPVLAETIDQRRSDLEILARKICSTPKPKPPPPAAPSEAEGMEVEGSPKNSCKEAASAEEAGGDEEAKEEMQEETKA